MQIALSEVSYTYPGASAPTINSLSAVFPQGWSGLLGDNGCGKSTLANIIAGKLRLDSGTVTQGPFVYMCEQNVEAEPDGLVEFALDYGQEAKRLRRILRIQDDMPWRFSELSCGEQKKLQIALALWRRPDVLILDEPTNHIDRDVRLELIDALQGYAGIGVLISHDRELLDALVKRCFSFEAGKLVMCPGTYSEAFAQADLERASLEHERRQAKRELARLAAEKDARSREADRASSRSSKHGIDAKDHSAKAKIDLARVSGQDGARGKLSAQMDGHLSAAQKRVEGAHVAKRYGGGLWVGSHPHSRKTLLRVESATIPCGDGQLFIPQLFVGNTDHIGIIGANGAGKSTLLAYLRTLIAHDIRTLDIQQELSTEQRRGLISRKGALAAREGRGDVDDRSAQFRPEEPARERMPQPRRGPKARLGARDHGGFGDDYHG